MHCTQLIMLQRMFAVTTCVPCATVVWRHFRAVCHRLDGRLPYAEPNTKESRRKSLAAGGAIRHSNAQCAGTPHRSVCGYPTPSPCVSPLCLVFVYTLSWQRTRSHLQTDRCTHRVANIPPPLHGNKTVILIENISSVRYQFPAWENDIYSINECNWISCRSSLILWNLELPLDFVAHE